MLLSVFLLLLSACSVGGSASEEKSVSMDEPVPVITAVGDESVLMRASLVALPDSDVNRYYDVVTENDRQMYSVLLEGNRDVSLLPMDATTVYVSPGGEPYVEQVSVTYFTADGASHSMERFRLVVVLE